MRSALLAAALLAAAGSAPALAEDGGAAQAISLYCESLIAGSSARDVAEAARQGGFRDETIAGRAMLRSGEVLLGLSDAPRVCFVQAPAAMTREEGFALADAWAARFPGAERAAATIGPDGSPVRAWTVPARRIALIATYQDMSSGRRIMSFVLMPLPQQARR